MFNILIIDDTRSVHAFVKSLLSQAQGITTTDAYNGEEALEILRNGTRFDLILLDWEMPKLNGPDTLTRIQSMGVEAPAIMMTTKNAPEDITRMLEAGAKEYMMKPFTIDILFEKIAYVTGRTFPYGS